MNADVVVVWWWWRENERNAACRQTKKGEGKRKTVFGRRKGLFAFILIKYARFARQELVHRKWNNCWMKAEGNRTCIITLV